MQFEEQTKRREKMQELQYYTIARNQCIHITFAMIMILTTSVWWWMILYLVGASAATFLTILLLEFDRMKHFHEWRIFGSFDQSSLVSRSNGSSNVGFRAFAASWHRLGRRSRFLGFTSRLVAHEFALWTRAQVWLFAFPIAFSLFAHGSADWFRSNARSTAVSRGANSFALGAVVLFAHILGAANVALGLVAVNLAASTGSLFALNLALWTFADRVAFGWANGIIALPTADGVAFSFSCSHEAFSVHTCDQSNSDNGEEEEFAHFWREESEKKKRDWNTQ